MFWKRKKLNESVTFVDLNSSMIDAMRNPPKVFVSKFDFAKSDVKTILESIQWFENCGKPLTLDLSMPLNRVESLERAIQMCQTLEWENTTLEAKNQLTIWLHFNDNANYQNWNEIAKIHKQETLDGLIAKQFVPFQKNHDLDITFVY